MWITARYYTMLKYDTKCKYMRKGFPKLMFINDKKINYYASNELVQE